MPLRLSATMMGLSRKGVRGIPLRQSSPLREKGRALEPLCKGPLLRSAPVTDNPRSLACTYITAPALAA